ncbi:hypothetical protein DP113_28395 [Brasilonema octagenarum UFV-E1]|uniref:DUF4335 domain-containing protein n=1 Tax=Brasilonema sennae CENA114 TaxID=415709 RepID=A0A856MM12_9CYAN|nr:DUF4335 domain-containing protein [Brasilonema sennae]QDL12475.1 hypothetical protein DP114_28485 [Brasilonema sennae CENA114]QDL18866.1 hypothetical protein DP113_28395 [Brasilonema octagenarum UFV-E1]
MPVSNSVIRRYTPPTCTLEVLAQSSALSQWMGKSVLKQLQFELRFDDPRLPEEKRIAIRGDSDQLETLCAVVTGYVQEFLEMSPERFWTNFSDTNFSGTQDVTVVSDQTEQTNFYNPPSQKIPTRNSFTHPSDADIKIKPSDHLTHNLFLGSLANPASGPVIQLSLLQLFDLATALDEYSADVVALPNLTPRSTRRSGIPAWAPVAAVLVIAVGLAPVTWQYANRVRQQQTAKKPTSTEQKIALQTPPSQDLSASTAVPTLPPSSSSLSSPPLPPFGSTLGVPNSKASPSIAQTLPSVPVTPQTSVKSTFPSVAQTFPSIGNVAKAPLTPLGNPLSIPGTTNPPGGTTKTPSISTFPQNTAPKQEIALQPKLQPNTTALTSKSELPSTLAQKNSTPNNLPSTNNTSSTPTGASLLRGTSPKDATRIAADPGKNFPNGQAIQDGETSSLGTSPLSSTSASREPVSSQPGTSTPSGTDALISRLRQARANRANIPTEVATNSTTRGATLFDTPQVSEARDALKKRWQPPSGLKQSIEYSLSVGVDGTIERILPMGKAARDYVDRTGMPLIGEPFVSPNKNGQSVRIRAIFRPDGKVQTFSETE